MSGFATDDMVACRAALLSVALVIVSLTALLTSLVVRGLVRDEIKGKIDRHDDLYEEIRSKAAAAAAADYTGVPAPLFDLFSTLTAKLDPLIDLGGSMRFMVDRIGNALNRATSFTSPKHPVPADGTTVVIQPNPPQYLTQTQSHPSANSELERAARDFYAFWQDQLRIKALIRSTIRDLAGDFLSR